MSRKTAAAAPYELRKDRGSWHRRPRLYSLHRKQYRRRFSSFSRKEHLLFHFILYFIVYFFVIYFHKKKSRFLFIFISLLLFVSPPKTVDRGATRCCYRSIYYYVWLQLAAQDRYSYIGTTTMYYVYIILYTI